MILVDNALKKREKNNNPIKVGIIGAGVMADVLMNQITKYYPGIQISVVTNRTLENAISLYQNHGIQNFNKANSAQEIDANIDNNLYSVTNDYSIVAKSRKIDVIVEITGTVDFGAKVVLTAIEHKKHIISFNAELDATLGPILHYKAQKAGIIYTGSDGDQPGVTYNLYRFVKSLGLIPIVCGNIKGFHNPYRTPKTQENFAKTWNIGPEKATSFADGTKLSFEQCCVANATGMKVEKRGMRGDSVDGHVDQCVDIYDVNKIKKLGGVIDYLVGAKPGPGVFIYAITEDPTLKHQLKYLKMGEGPVYSFYTPYHLCMLEVPNSIVRVVDFQDKVLTPLGKPVVEVITKAKSDLKAGQRLDGYGGYTSYGECENSDIVIEENLLPIGLADGAILKSDLKKDSVITFDNVEFQSESLALQLYKEQRKLITENININVNK
jgi:predicted homoserine dehydrogenase-like protein